jgi:hypothetical protein
MNVTNWFLGLGVVSLAATLVLGALQARGVTGRGLSRFLLVLSWLFIIVAATTYPPEEVATARHRLVFGSIAAILSGVFLFVLERWLESQTPTVKESPQADFADLRSGTVNLVAIGLESDYVREDPESRIVDRRVVLTSLQDNHLLLERGHDMFALCARFRNEPQAGAVVHSAQSVQAQIYYFQAGSKRPLWVVEAGIWQGRKGATVTFGVGDARDLVLLLTREDRIVFGSAQFEANGQRKAMSMNVDLELEIYIRLFHKSGNRKGEVVGTYIFAVAWKRTGGFAIHRFGPAEFPADRIFA